VSAQSTVRYQQVGQSQIPIVDLSPARGGDPARLADLVGTLGEVCLASGFFYVENHGIPEELVRATQAQTVEFFDLPAAEKANLHIAKSRFHRGYFPEGEENTRGYPHPDVKEGFEIAVERTLDDPHVIAGTPLHGPNSWPATLPRFRPALAGMFDSMRALCDSISSMLAVGMGLPSDFFANKTDDPIAQMRIMRYPPQQYVPVDAVKRVGSGPHTDYGIVSIIWQMDAPGLEIQTHSGAWISAPYIPGTFICLLGDAMQILTNDVWKAPVHRVVNATGLVRHALVYFHDPNYHCPIAPIDRFVTPERPARHGETTMGTMVMNGFNGSYAYRSWGEGHT
jgi:isopenicillin N synthase-like dioxygenase